MYEQIDPPCMTRNIDRRANHRVPLTCFCRQDLRADLPFRRVSSAERGPNNIACEGRRT
jgi:hypothetical protein